MHSLEINGKGELRRQLADPGSLWKMAVKMEWLCLCMHAVLVWSISCEASLCVVLCCSRLCAMTCRDSWAVSFFSHVSSIFSPKASLWTSIIIIYLYLLSSYVPCFHFDFTTQNVGHVNVSCWLIVFVGEKIVMTVLDIVSFADQGDSFFKHTDNLPNTKKMEKL